MARASQPPGNGDAPNADEGVYLARARALLPQIASAADEIERGRRIPEPLLDALIDAGLYRMLVPRSVGGGEAHPLEFMRVLESIAAADASTAWNIGQNAVCGIVAAYLPPEMARHVFGDKRAILAWGPPTPETRADVADGGYRLSGTWSFASGGRHANWLGGYAPIYEPDGSPRRTEAGAVLSRVMLFPAEHATFTDAWNVIGLRGTASDTFSVRELMVPHELTVFRDNNSENREPGWLYAFSTTNLYPCGFASVALGVARSMLDALERLAAEKTPRGYASTLAQNAATQAEVAQAEARWRSARAFLVQTVRETCADVERTHELTLEQRVSIRLASTHAITEARGVGEFAYEAAGASAIFVSNPFERRFRDLHAISQQLQGRKSHFQTVGRYLLGVEGDLPFL